MSILYGDTAVIVVIKKHLWTFQETFRVQCFYLNGKLWRITFIHFEFIFLVHWVGQQIEEKFIIFI